MPDTPRQVRSQLSNGLPLLVVELPHLHVAALGCFVRTGSQFESHEDAGLSHFVEHMLHRGTDRYPDSLSLHRALDSAGLDLYADTGPSLSRYLMTHEPAMLEAAAELLGEMIARPLWCDLELERELVLEEIDGAEDDDTTGDVARALMFGVDHPLARPVLGARHNVERFTEADVRRHHQRFYTGQNMLVIAAGPVDAGAVCEAAERSLGSIAPGAQARAEPIEVTQTDVVFDISGGGDRVLVTLLFRADASNTRDRARLSALAYALDGGMASPLHYRICDQLGLAYEVGASTEQLDGLLLMDITAETSSAKTASLVTEVLAVVDRLTDAPVDAAELARIQRLHAVENTALLDSPDALVSRIGHTALFDEPQSIEQMIGELEPVTAEQVREAATAAFVPERLAVAISGRLSPAARGEAREAIEDWRR